MINTIPEPPHSDDNEMAVIGSVLIEPDTIYRLDFLKPEHFFIVKNGWIWAALEKMSGARIPLDYLTLCTELEHSGKLSDIGGAAYLSQIINSVPTAIHAEGYGRIVLSMAIRRGMLAAASEIARLAYDTEGNIDEQMARAASSVSNMPVASRSSLHVSVVASELYDQVSEWSHNPLVGNDVRGLRCHIRPIDKMLGGFERQLLYIWAGRPGMGKSALVDQIGVNVARHGGRVLIVSIEMSARQVLSRLVCADALIRWDEVKRGNMTEEQWRIITEKISDLSTLPLYICDSSRITTSKVESEVARLGNLDLVIVDHLGLLDDRCSNGENETIRIGRMSWALKQIAKQYHVPVLCVCQLNRSVEARQDKRPLLSDLRQSGDIEQNADDVLMLYRDDYYNQNSLTPNVVEIIPRKLRDGDTSEVAELHFRKEYVRFDEIERRSIE